VPSLASDDVKETGSAATSVKLRKCFFCHEPGHLVKDCPKKAAAKEERATTPLVVSRTLQSAYTMSVSTDPVAGFARYEVGHDDMSSVHGKVFSSARFRFRQIFRWVLFSVLSASYGAR
jgi:hypothetical protein